MEIKFGWIPSIPDVRDLKYVPPMMADLPTSIDLRPQMPPVYSQGNVGSCVAQSLAGLIQYEEIKNTQESKSIPSRLFVYYNARLIQNTVNYDSGTSMRTGIQSLVRYGYCEEELWPYDTAKWKNKPIQTAYRKAYMGRITKYSRIKQDINTLKTALAAGTCFVFGFTVYSNFMTPEVKQSGIQQMPEGQMLGGHAILCGGFSDEDQTFLIRNSWGSEWGIGGYFKMPYAYISNPDLASDFWVLNS